MDEIEVMFVLKHIDQKPFCNDRNHLGLKVEGSRLKILVLSVSDVQCVGN